MSKMKRTLALLAVLAMASTSFVACGGDKEESKADSAADSVADSAEDSAPESKDDEASAEESADDTTGERDFTAAVEEEGTLSVVCWTDADLNNMFAQYCESRGMEVGTDVAWVQCGTSGGEGNTQYATFLNSGEDVDLFVAEAGWILNYIETDEYAIPLSDLGIEASEYTNAYQYTVDIATSGDKLMGASWQAAAGGFCYYTDMAEEYLGITDAAAMQEAVKDWDAFKATAATLKDKGVTICASLGGLWQCYSTSQSAAWTDGTTLKTDIAADFTTFAKEMVDAGYVDPTIPQWEDPWYNAGNAGETFGYFFSTWCLPAEAQLQQCMGDAGNVGIVVGPSEYFWGGSWLCASKNINNKEKAADFVRYFTIDTASMKEYAENTGDFVNNKEAMADVTFANDLLGGQDQFAVLKEVAEGIDLSDTISKYDQTLKDTFLTSLRDNIDGSADDIMADFKADVKAAVPELTVE